MHISFGLLSICPRIRKEADTLVLSTGRKAMLLTLGLCMRRVVVDRAKRQVHIESRYAWVVERERTVAFSEIRAITYGYADQSLSGPFSMTHDALDVYRIGLRLHDGEEIHLFRFIGEGAWVNDTDWPDWLFWEEKAFDAMGTQDRDSLAAVQVLCKLIRVPVRPPR